MNKLRTRWAASIAGLAVTSCVQAAEINFEHAIDTPGAATETGALRHIIRKKKRPGRLWILLSQLHSSSPRHTKFTAMRTLDLPFLQARLPHFLPRAANL